MHRHGGEDGYRTASLRHRIRERSSGRPTACRGLAVDKMQILVKCEWFSARESLVSQRGSYVERRRLSYVVENVVP